MKIITSLCIAPALLLSGTAAGEGPEQAPEAGAIVEVVPAFSQDGVNFTAVAPSQDGAAQHVVIVQTDDDGKRELRMKDGHYRVIINGREIEAPHVDREGNRFIVRTPGGDQITTFEYTAPPATVGRQRVMFAPDLQGDVGFFNVQPQMADMPPVMLGVSMDQPDEALRYHLGLGDREAILITQVVDGTPASAAGLKRFDVIVSINGSEGATSGRLHDVLMGSQPGDELKLKIRRGGDTIKLVADLAPYDAQKLASGQNDMTEEVIIGDMPFWTPQAPAAPAQPFVWRGQDGRWQDTVREQLRKQLSGRELEEAQRAIEEAMRGMEFNVQPGEGVGVFEFRWDGNDHKLVIPKGAQRWQQDLTDQWGAAMRFAEPHVEHGAHEAEERFEKIQHDLEARMDRLAERLEHLTRLLERHERD